MSDPVQRGRYAVHPEDGGLMIAWTQDLCATCSECGCGVQGEPWDLTRKGMFKTAGRIKKMLADAGVRLPMMAGGGDGGPRRGR